MARQLLLLEDVDGLGRSGDLVIAKPGYTRNFLLPQKKAVVADKQTLKMRVHLQKEREKQAAIDRQESAELAGKLASVVLSIEVKTDPDGKMYGSVTTLDLARLLQEHDYPVERKHIVLAHPIKHLGQHKVELKLKEGVLSTFTVEVLPEHGLVVTKQEETGGDQKEDTNDNEGETPDTQ